MGTLSELLHDVEIITRIEQNTILCLKGKFAPVCVNIDITRPLSSSLTIARQGFSTRIPFIYEGLHEIYPVCGGESHQFESCPNLPMSKKVEVPVERFDAQGVSFSNKSQSHSTHGTSKPIDTRVTVTLKKRMRSNKSYEVVHSTNTVVAVVISPVSAPIIPAPLPLSPSSYLHPAPVNPEGIILANTTTAFLSMAKPVANSNPLHVLHGGFWMA